ncbi:MAG: radical SAM protein [Deltaproteobacteria bacterium CG23_combo_of_CG06-09_8_20_14_all_60_8]|nr:MAG: radical SAM protein [Deltaproteobacteria bacterium CG23_combo_of_CG06-09_8_20_14_all_60_8]
MLLLHPPVAKPCEPPGGIARLTGFLRGHGLPCTVADLNLEGQLFLLNGPTAPTGAWSRRACRDITANLRALGTPQLYTTPARYQRAVLDVNRVLAIVGRARQIELSLANYQDSALSPLRSTDLIQAAARPEANVFFPYFAARLPQLLAASRPALVGFSLNYLSQALCTFAMVGFLKQRYPGLPVVLGGGLVTSWCRNPGWHNPFIGLIDHLVAGPGEGPLLTLLGGQPRGGHQPPDYADLRHTAYLAPGFILPYAASSGCYWNQCSFCPEKAEANPYLQVPAAQALDDIQHLVARTGPILLHLLDNAISPALMRELVARPPGVGWYGFARVSPLLTDAAFCLALRRAGCVMLKLGLESGDQGVLDAMHKGIDLAMVSATLAALQKAGIATYVYLLFGTPSESINEARRTLRYVADEKAAITFLNLAVFNMPVCGAEADSLAVRDFYAADLTLYTDFKHPLGWDRQAVRRFLDQEFKRHPAVAAILRRDPPLFTSNHAPFFRN